MKIAILGAGNAGCAAAADLTRTGNEVTLIKTSATLHERNFDFLLENGGRMTLEENGVRTAFPIARVTRELSALRGAEVVLLQIQTSYHEDLIRRVLPFLGDGQILLINPGYLSTAYVLKYGGGRELTVAEAESAFLDGRITEPGLFRVGSRNVRNPVGIYPAARSDEVFRKLLSLGEPLLQLRSVCEAALHNPNLIVHTVGAALSIPQIEKYGKTFCMYHEVYTRNSPATWRVVEALDREKMDVLDALGLPRVRYVDACRERNSLEQTLDGREVFLRYAEMPTRAPGPAAVDSRYLSEDVPQGLVLLESFGKALGVDTPVTSGLIALTSAALGRDLRAEGRTLERLGNQNVVRILDDLSSVIR